MGQKLRNKGEVQTREGYIQYLSTRMETTHYLANHLSFETVKDKTKGGVVMNDAPSLYIKKKGRIVASLLSYNTKPSYSADVANGAGVV